MSKSIFPQVIIQKSNGTFSGWVNKQVYSDCISFRYIIRRAGVELWASGDYATNSFPDAEQKALNEFEYHWNRYPKNFDKQN